MSVPIDCILNSNSLIPLEIAGYIPYNSPLGTSSSKSSAFGGSVGVGLGKNIKRKELLQQLMLG